MVDPGFSFLTQQQVALGYGAKDTIRVGEAAGTGIFLNTIIALILAGAASVLVLFLPVMISFDPGVDFQHIQNACWISCLGMGLNVAALGLRAVNTGLQSSVSVQSFLILELSASMIIQVWLIQRGWLLYGLAMGSLVRGGGDLVLNSIYLFYRLSRERIRIRCTKTALGNVFGLTTFTFSSRAIETIASNFDSFITAKIISPEAAVVLRTTRTPIDVCTSIVNRPAAAIAPVLTHIVGAGELLAKRTQILRIVRISVWFIALSGAGLLSLNEVFITKWVGRDFYAGFLANGVLCMGLVAMSIFRLLSNMTNAIGQIKETSFATIWQSVATLFFMVLFGHYWGLVGIALGAVIAAVLSAIYCFRLLFAAKLFDRECMLDLAKESSSSIFSSSIAIAAIWWVPFDDAARWSGLVTRATGFSLIFILSLLLCSKNARVELMWSVNFAASLIAKALRKIQS